MFRNYLKACALEICYELEDLLLSKEAWLAVLGVIIAVSKWQGWNVPTDVFFTIEILIVAVIVALAKRRD